MRITKRTRCRQGLSSLPSKETEKEANAIVEGITVSFFTTVSVQQSAADYLTAKPLAITQNFTIVCDPFQV